LTGQLANAPAAELEKLHGVGPKALRLLQEAFEQHGRSLAKAALPGRCDTCHNHWTRQMRMVSQKTPMHKYADGPLTR
jgi:hypothetical protein